MTIHDATALVSMGVTLQLGWMLYPWKEIKPAVILGCLGLAVFIVAFGAARQHRDLNDEDVLIASGLFVAVMAITYREQLMPWIQELALVLWAPVSVYALEISWGLRDWRFELFSMLTVGVVIAVFVVRTLTPLVRLVFYSAYLLQIVLVALLQFRFGDFSAISNGTVPDGEPLRFLFDGMGMTYLAVYGWYLARVIPIPGRGQSIHNRMKEWHQETETMERHFSVLRLNPSYAFGVLFLVSATLAVNHRAGWAEPWTMIGLVLTVVPNVLKTVPVLQIEQPRPGKVGD